MGKILESLQNTIIAGIVLTVIMVALAPMIAATSEPESAVETTGGE